MDAAETKPSGWFDLTEERLWIPCPVCEKDLAKPQFQKNSYMVVQCQACGVGYVNPQPKPGRLADFYRTEYFAPGSPQAAGAQHLAQRDIKRATARLRLRLIQELGPKGRLLDMGCGGGYFLQAAQEGGWSAVGLEPWPDSARQAARGRHIRVIAGRLEQPPLAARSFDLVTMLDVLEHLVNPRECLERARSLLAPGGFLMVETPNMVGWLTRLLGSRHPFVRPPEHLLYFTPSSLRLLLEQTGFRCRHFQTSAPKVLTLEYVLGLTQSTNPLVTTLARGTVGRWRALSRHPFTVPMDMLLAVAAVAEPEVAHV